MKWAIFVLFFFTSARAVTCRVLEGSGGDGNAATKIAASKIAWEECIARKISERERLRGPTSEDDAIADAEACLNAKLECK